MLRPMVETKQLTDLFLKLTPEKVLAAVEASGILCHPVCYPLNSFENRVYEVETEDRTRIISKFYRPNRWNRDQILEEHQFLQDLETSEFPVCPTLKFPDGETLKSIDGIYYCLYEKRGGRAPDELDDTLAQRLGMLVARLHNVAVTRESDHRIQMTPDIYIRQNLEWLKANDSLPEHLLKRYENAALSIADIADEYLQSVTTHRIHGDFHMGNLLLRDGQFNLLDFDDMVVGPPVQDLWLLLPGQDDYTIRLRDTFLKGYEQFREFDHTTLRLIEPLRGMRMVHYTTWLARRWHDPVFPRTWPHFGTEEYWEEETGALEDIVQGVYRDSPTHKAAATTPDEAEGMTNKDYFFDWED